MADNLRVLDIFDLGYRPSSLNRVVVVILSSILMFLWCQVMVTLTSGENIWSSATARQQFTRDENVVRVPRLQIEFGSFRFSLRIEVNSERKSKIRSRSERKLLKMDRMDHNFVPHRALSFYQPEPPI